jgi:hypothetical protein
MVRIATCASTYSSVQTYVNICNSEIQRLYSEIPVTLLTMRYGCVKQGRNRREDRGWARGGDPGPILIGLLSGSAETKRRPEIKVRVDHTL